VFRSSPQFGVTLLTYELLQRVFKVDFSGKGWVHLYRYVWVWAAFICFHMRIAISSDFRACMSCVVMHSRRFLCVVKESEFRSSFLKSYFELKPLLSFHCQLSCNLKEFETLSSVAKFAAPEECWHLELPVFFFWNTVLVKNKNCY